MKYKNIGRRIVALRHDNKWSIRELARRAEVSPMTVIYAESGGAVNLDTLYNISRALKVDLATLAINARLDDNND